MNALRYTLLHAATLPIMLPLNTCDFSLIIINIFFWLIFYFFWHLPQFCCLAGILCILCSTVRVHNFRGAFYLAVGVLSCFATTLLLLLHIFVWCHQQHQQQFYKIDFIKYETYLYMFLSCMQFLAASIAVTLDMTSYSMAAVSVDFIKFSLRFINIF